MVVFPEIATQTGVDLSLMWPPAEGRISGVAAHAFGDMGGFGIELGVGYETLRRPTLDGGSLSLHSAVATVALRLSLVRLLANAERRIGAGLRWIDVHADAGLTGGISEDVSQLRFRGGAWIGAGIDVRLGFAGWRTIPVLSLRARYEPERGPSYAPAVHVLVGAGACWLDTVQPAF